MSTYSQHCHHCQEQPLLIDPHAFVYGQYDDRRSKTPTDPLINHTELSPRPLSTPPVSRNQSQQPELPQNQLPEQLLWDNGSSSNPATSLRTHDGSESFKLGMLEYDSMPTYYHHNPNMSTQSTHNAIPAGDSGMVFTDQGNFSDQAVQAAFRQILAPVPQRYPQQHNFQAQQQQLLPISTVHGQTNYTTQPPHHDPWNGQGPSRSSMVPRSHLDPVTGPFNKPDYLINWTTQYTDPSSLISPGEPSVPPQDNVYFPTTQNPAHQPYSHIPWTQSRQTSPVEIQLTPSSSPLDQQDFVNDDASSSLFTTSYITRNQFPALPSAALSTSHHLRSPYQPVISTSAASPGSSDGMYSSYQHRDSGMIYDQHQTQHYVQRQHRQAPALSMYFDAVPEPESSANVAQEALAPKSGGRAFDTHPKSTVAKHAHDMSKVVACWHCVLQRDKCSPGDICERCHKRSQRPDADCGLGCNRMKLVDLLPYFLPALVTQMHEASNLTHFVTQNIQHWGNVELTVWMTCGQNHMPRLPVKVYEFVPHGDALLVQIQYKTDPTTYRRFAFRKQSPALGMVHIHHSEEKKYDEYITDIVDNHLDAFGELCWKEDDNDFQQKLFKLMTRVKLKSDDETKLLREIFRLIVVTFIMSHTLTIAEETKVATLSRMHSYGGKNSYADNYTSPRMTNRQLKYFFSRLQHSIQTNVLNKLQQILKSSDGCDKWIAAFVAVLGMCMALEDQQKTIHLVMSTKASTEGMDQRDAQKKAHIACSDIDQRMRFVQQIFRLKYNRKYNPLRDSERHWGKEVGFEDPGSMETVRQVAQLVKENVNFLHERQLVGISDKNQTEYTSRLVAWFLLSFWLPNK